MKPPNDLPSIRRPPAGYRSQKINANAKLRPGENTQGDERGRAHQNNEGHQGGQHGGSQRKDNSDAPKH